MVYSNFSHVPYSKAEVKNRGNLNCSYDSAMETFKNDYPYTHMNSKPEDIAPLTNIAQASMLPKLDVPFHKTRRHFKNFGNIRHTNVWDCDPEPANRAAGLATPTSAYNIINGQHGVRDKYALLLRQNNGNVPNNINASISADFIQLPKFIRKKFQFQNERLSTSIYHQNQAHNKSSSIFY